MADAVTYQFRFKTAPVPRVDPADLAAPPGGGKEFFAQLTGTFARAATSSTARSFASDSATVMLTLARLWLSLAETTVWITSTPASTARTAPLSLGTRAA